MPRFYKYLVIVQLKNEIKKYTIFANNDIDLKKRLFNQYPKYRRLKKDKIFFEKYYK